MSYSGCLLAHQCINSVSRRLIIGKVQDRILDKPRGKKGKLPLGTIITLTNTSSSRRYTTTAHEQAPHLFQHPRPGVLDCADTLCTVNTLIPRVPSLQLYATRASRESRTFDSPRQPL
jgi:hypothetical protein